MVPMRDIKSIRVLRQLYQVKKAHSFRTLGYREVLNEVQSSVELKHLIIFSTDLF